MGYATEQVPFCELESLNTLSYLEQLTSVSSPGGGTSRRRRREPEESIVHRPSLSLFQLSSPVIVMP